MHVRYGFEGYWCCLDRQECPSSMCHVPFAVVILFCFGLLCMAWPEWLGFGFSCGPSLGLTSALCFHLTLCCRVQWPALWTAAGDGVWCRAVHWQCCPAGHCGAPLFPLTLPPCMTDVALSPKPASRTYFRSLSTCLSRFDAAATVTGAWQGCSLF